MIAEFFVDKSGWVPVDIAGTVFNKPKDMHALFGSTDGQFLTFHINTDLQPAKEFRDPSRARPEVWRRTKSNDSKKPRISA
jgi:hypothetical protein